MLLIIFLFDVLFRNVNFHFLFAILGSHRRQKDSDYSSTSEEEFETNSKHKCSHASASTQTQAPQKTIQMRLKCGTLETEEDETQNEHFQNWSTHSAEIARLFNLCCCCGVMCYWIS